MTAGREPSWAASLRDVVGSHHVLTDADATAGYTVDWTGRFRGTTPAVVRPGSAVEVAGVVGVCRDHGLAVVPQGGNTGLVGGSVPLAGEIVLSLRRLDEVEFDADAAQLLAGAGATIASIQAAARAGGWEYGVDWGARDSATVGGSIATNAGGVRVIRHGDTRANLLGVEAVLADGSTIRRLHGLIKDNTGYALGSLLCGSEGTLGVVTAARLRLVPHEMERVVALVGFADVAGAIAAAVAMRKELRTLDACELMEADGTALVARAIGAAPPFEAAVTLLIECAADRDPAPELAAVLDGLGSTEVAVATEPGRRAELWRWREQHSEVINRLGPPIKLDVTLPIANLASFVEAVRSRVGRVAPGSHTWIFGHAADGNVHVNVTGWGSAAEERIEATVLELVVELRGSISAEHGIGTAKRRWLMLDRGEADVAAMRAVKRALDPDGLFNPNVLLP
ncbi:MAG: FAD-binding oxidoreductase [Acidimicrobiales bacterium]